MLIGGNELKNTLKTQYLTFSGTQNELLFEFRNPRSNPKKGLKIRVQEPGFCGEETDVEGVRSAQQGRQPPLFSLDNVSLPAGKKKTLSFEKERPIPECI
jgi:hypothetical protein